MLRWSWWHPAISAPSQIDLVKIVLSNCKGFLRVCAKIQRKKKYGGVKIFQLPCLRRVDVTLLVGGSSEVLVSKFCTTSSSNNRSFYDDFGICSWESWHENLCQCEWEIRVSTFCGDPIKMPSTALAWSRTKITGPCDRLSDRSLLNLVGPFPEVLNVKMFCITFCDRHSTKQTFESFQTVFKL